MFDKKKLEHPRIMVEFTPNTDPVPINNQEVVNRYIHNDVLGPHKNFHDGFNEHCISQLYGNDKDDDKEILNFSNGGYLIISSLDPSFMDELCPGFFTSPHLGFGMKFNGNISPIEKEVKSIRGGFTDFVTLTPILIRDSKGHATVEDEDFEERLNEYLLKKLKGFNNKYQLGLDLSRFKVSVIKTNKEGVEVAREKTVWINGTPNKCSICKLRVYSDTLTARLLYHIGVGQSTGSGFGTICRMISKKRIYGA